MSNRIHDAFDQIKASTELKESTRDFIRSNYTGQKKRTLRPAWKIASAVACALFILSVGAGFYVVQTPVSYISIDVNPSIELTLNRFDRVISASAYNEDAKDILENLDMDGELYSEAIDQIMASTAMQAYLDQNIPVFTVASDIREKDASLLARIQECSGYAQHGGQSCRAEVSLVSEAHTHDMSLGKYAAYCELSQYDDSVTVEDCHDMPMSEIHRQIQEHKKECEHQSTGGEQSTDNYQSTGSKHHGTDSKHQSAGGEHHGAGSRHGHGA